MATKQHLTEVIADALYEETDRRNDDLCPVEVTQALAMVMGTVLARQSNRDVRASLVRIFNDYAMEMMSGVHEIDRRDFLH